MRKASETPNSKAIKNHTCFLVLQFCLECFQRGKFNSHPRPRPGPRQLILFLKSLLIEGSALDWSRLYLSGILMNVDSLLHYSSSNMWRQLLRFWVLSATSASLHALWLPGLLGTHFSLSVSLLKSGILNWMYYSRCGLTSAQFNGTVTFRGLKSTLY